MPQTKTLLGPIGTSPGHPCASQANPLSSSRPVTDVNGTTGVDVAIAPVLRAAHRPESDITPSRVPWRQLTSIACKAWLGGLLLEAIERHDWKVEQSELQQLRWQAMQIRCGNRHLLQALASIATALRDRNIQVLLLKGAGLNLTLYHEASRRPMSDLDLLVRQEDLAEAMSALVGAGFAPGRNYVRRDFFPRFHYAMEYRAKVPKPVRVDLHARAFRPLKYAQTVDDNVFWERSRLVELGGAELHVPADEQQFVHLATHSACHGHSRIIWLYDLCRLADACGQSLDWDRIAQVSRRLQLVLPVRQALHEVETRWGPIAPHKIRDALRQQRVGWRDRLCLAQAPNDSSRPIRHVTVDLICTHGIRFRFGYLRRVLFPDAHHMRQFYHRRHRAWILLAHLSRWLRALSRPVARSFRPVESSA